MRLRNVKGSREQIAENKYVLKEAEKNKGKWADIFHDGKPIHLEIGMGKGRFLMEMARLHPDVQYIGIEKYSSVLVRALEKMEEARTEKHADHGLQRQDGVRLLRSVPRRGALRAGIRRPEDVPDGLPQPERGHARYPG